MASTKPSKDKNKYMFFFILNVIEDTDLIRRTDNFCLILFCIKLYCILRFQLNRFPNSFFKAILKVDFLILSAVRSKVRD